MKHWIAKKLENFMIAFVFMLPRRIAHWSVIRVWAHATCRVHTDKSPDQVTWSMALKAWEQK